MLHSALHAAQYPTRRGRLNAPGRCGSFSMRASVSLRSLGRVAAAAEPTLEEEEEELARAAAELEEAENDSTRAGALQLLTEAEELGANVAPKAADIAGALDELDSLGASEREVLARAAELLKGFGVTLPLPPATIDDDVETSE